MHDISFKNQLHRATSNARNGTSATRTERSF